MYSTISQSSLYSSSSYIATVTVDYSSLEELAYIVENNELSTKNRLREQDIIKNNPTVKEAYDSYKTLLALYLD
jgi:hypothetical protein